MSKISFLIFHNFVKKISSKWSVKTFVSIVIFLVKMAPKNEKNKRESTSQRKMEMDYHRSTGAIAPVAIWKLVRKNLKFVAKSLIYEGFNNK